MSYPTLMQVLGESPDIVRLAIADITRVLYGPGVNSEDRLDVMLALTRRKPASVFWPVFHETWPGCDDAYDLRNRLLKILTTRDGEARSTDYLTDDARAFLEELPNPFTAYRGCSKRRVNGVSWTTNEAVAEEFAQGHQGIAIPDPCVATASVPKSAVFGVYMDGKAVEVVINARRVGLTSRHLSFATQSIPRLSPPKPMPSPFSILVRKARPHWG